MNGFDQMYLKPWMNWNESNQPAHLCTELQIRADIEDNSKIIFLISPGIRPQED